MNWRSVGRWALAVIATVAFVILAGTIAIHTSTFHRFLLNTVREKAQTALNTRVSIGNMAVHWTGLSVDVYDVDVYGTREGAPPIFEAPHLLVGLRIAALLRRRVDLSDLILDRPTLRISVDQKGRSDIPGTRSPSASPANYNAIFDLSIRNVQINSGDAYFDDRQIPISGEVHDLQAKIGTTLMAGSYTGSVAYQHARILSPALHPIEHALDVRFKASRDSLVIEALTLMAGASRLEASGRITNFANPNMEASYKGQISLNEVAQAIANRSLPTGTVMIAGNAKYEESANHPFIENLSLTGQMSAPNLRMGSFDQDVSASAVRADYTMEHGNIHVQNVSADLVGGHLTADWRVSPFSGNLSSSLTAALRGASLARLSGGVPITKSRRPLFLGTLNAEISATWNNSIRDAIGKAHVVVSNSRNDIARNGIPLNGDIQVSYNGIRNVATFGDSHLRSSKTEIALKGTVSKNSALTVHAATGDLGEVMQMVAVVQNLSGSMVSASMPRLAGTAVFDGQVSGEPADPSFEGALSAANLSVNDIPWREARTQISLDASGVRFQHAVLIDADRGQIAFSGEAGLQHWAFTNASPLSISLAASDISVEHAQRLANYNYPVAGVLNARISVMGSLRELNGNGSLQITKGEAWGQPVSNLTASFQGAGGAIKTQMQAQLPAGSVTADLRYSMDDREYDVNLDSKSIVLQQLEYVQRRNFDVAGSVSVSAKGHGTFADPMLQADVRMPNLQFGGQTISNTQAQIAVANQRVNFSVNSEYSNGYVHSSGSADLRGDRMANISVDVRALPIGALLVAYSHGGLNGVEGTTEIHATASGPLSAPSRMQGQLEIPAFRLAYKGSELTLAAPLRADFRNAELTLQSADFRGSGTSLKVSGTVPVSKTGAMHVQADGTLDLAIAKAFSATVQSSGQASLHMVAEGQPSQPQLQGDLKLANAVLSTDSLPVEVEGLNAQIHFSGSRAEIAQFSGTAGGGTVTASGFVNYGKQSTFNVSLETKSVRLRYPEGLRTILDGNLNLAGTAEDSSLTGRVLVDRLSFTQAFDLSSFASQFSGESSVPSTSPFQQNMKLRISVASAQDLRVANRQVSVAGAANLNIVGTAANPVVLGRITMTGGDVFFLGKRYSIQSGTLAFANTVKTEATVNLYVSTTVEQYNITLNFVGPLDRLRTTYTADPALSSADIINLLAFGQTTAEAGSKPSEPASVGAESLLAKGVSGQISGKLEKLTGISQLSINPLSINGQQNPGTQVAIQQHITASLLLTFSTDVTSTQGQAVQVQYQANRHISVSALRDQNGGYGVDVKYHKNF